MQWFQSKPSPQEAMKASKRGITRSQRDLDREMRDLERQEQHLIAQIKAFARKGDNSNARLHTKQLVTVRQTKEKLANMKGTAIKLKIQVVNNIQANYLVYKCAKRQCRQHQA